MKTRIVVLNKGVDKETVTAESLCCVGAYVTLLWG